MTAPKLSNSAKIMSAYARSPPSSKSGLLTTAVVWRAEDCHQRPLVPKFVAILYHHVSPANKVKVVLGEELLNDSFAETVRHAALVILPV